MRDLAKVNKPFVFPENKNSLQLYHYLKNDFDENPRRFLSRGCLGSEVASNETGGSYRAVLLVVLVESY